MSLNAGGCLPGRGCSPVEVGFRRSVVAACRLAAEGSLEGWDSGVFVGPFWTLAGAPVHSGRRAVGRDSLPAGGSCTVFPLRFKLGSEGGRERERERRAVKG